MIVRANKYRRLDSNKAASITVASGDTLTVASGGIMTLASGSTVSATAATLVSPITKYRVIAATATTVLTAADSGAIVTLGTAGGFDTKLPAPAAGLNFVFVAKVAPTTAYTITSNGTTQNVIHGNNANSAGTAGDSTAGTAVDVITFAANVALIGDSVQIWCDGTLWYAVAISSAAAGITFD